MKWLTTPPVDLELSNNGTVDMLRGHRQQERLPGCTREPTRTQPTQRRLGAVRLGKFTDL